LRLLQRSNIDRNHGRETPNITFYAGLRLRQVAELWVNPEIDQGFGLSGTLGVAGFTSGEACKVGSLVPYTRLPRMFVRLTFDYQFIANPACNRDRGLVSVVGGRLRAQF
jgi:high affinity Mn2+ porin